MVQLVKNLAAMQEVACNAGDLSSIAGLGRCPGEGNDNQVHIFLPGESHGQGSLAGEGL